MAWQRAGESGQRRVAARAGGWSRGDLDTPPRATATAGYSAALLVRGRFAGRHNGRSRRCTQRAPSLLMLSHIPPPDLRRDAHTPTGSAPSARLQARPEIKEHFHLMSMQGLL